MTFVDICKAYAEVHGMNTVEVINQHNKGLITQYELFDAFLQNEGIFGYTQKIISAFRCTYEVE